MDLNKWWYELRDGDRNARLQTEASDPGEPATYGTCTGEPTPHPWSAVLGAVNRLPKILDMNKTFHSLLVAFQKAKNEGRK